MDKKQRNSFFDLAKKSLAVITASLTILPQNHSDAAPVKSILISGKDDSNSEKIQKRVFKPKLVLKLNFNSLRHRLVARHGSHSSHASHASSSPSSGHSSHTSHMSSSPTYYTPTETPTPSTSTPSNSTNTSTTSTQSTTTTTSSSTLTYYELGSRVLTKGCQGTDVEEVQKMLLRLGYDALVTGYYGDKTVALVKKFQTNNELSPTGEVDSQTLSVLKSK